MIPVERKGYVCGGILVVVIFVLAAANLLLGSVDIPAGAVWGALMGGTVETKLGRSSCGNPACLCA